MSIPAYIGPLVEEARQVWPQLDLDLEGFAAYVAERLPAPVPPELRVAEAAAWVRQRLETSDLWLAYGCARGGDAAVAAFQAKFGRTLDGVAGRFLKSGLSIEDLRQQLNEKLFVGETGKAPKILEYRGQGRLKHWLRVAALRTFLNEARRAKGDSRRSSEGEHDILALTPEADPELDFLKQRYRHAFKLAFEVAVAGLTDRERNLLWHKTVVGHSLEQIAAVYHLSRATAARHIARAREQLLQLTRAELMARLEVDRHEFDSIMNLIASRLDVSLSRMLRQ